MKQRKQRTYGIADFFYGYLDQLGQITLVNILFCIPVLIFGGLIILLSMWVPINIFVIMLLIPLLSPFAAGLFYAAKRITLKEELKAVRDFKKGIKTEWKPFLIDGIITFFISCGIYVTMQIYRGGLSDSLILTAFIISMIFVVFFICFQNSFLTMLVTVDIKPADAVKNAVLMFIGGFFYHLKILFALAFAGFLIFSMYMLINNTLTASLLMLVPVLLFLPILWSYIIVYNIFQTVEKNIITPFTENKDKPEETKTNNDAPPVDKDELISLSQGDPEEYVFVGGRMLKRKTILQTLENKNE